jgi:arginyl-tRNA synthetase
LAIALGKKLNHFRDEKAKEEKTVIFDYGGANIGKSLHVGHIRTLNIGRSLKNIYEIAGYKTISDIHFGDWGMPIGLILAYIENQNIDINEVSHKSLENIYPEASNLSKTDKNFYAKALEISKQLNEQDKNRISQWKKIYNISTENIKTLLNKLDFNFD